VVAHALSGTSGGSATATGNLRVPGNDNWWPADYANPAFQVQRQEYGLALGGDYVRGSTVATLPQTALRYPTATKGYDLVRSKGYLTIRPFDYFTAEIAWGWPVGVTEAWLEVALVRSGFGDPVTVNDGETVLYGNRAAFTADASLIPPPIVYDQPLQPGHWYYYSLFFKTTPLDWVRAMTGNVLIPRNYHHAEHLWDAVPPFYQTTDSNLREGEGPLRQFLSVFGFELDQTRAYVESWQQSYHIDTSPMALLKRVGENFGEPYAAGIGAIRYRGLLAALPEALSMRGTTAALHQIIEASSKYDCDITVGGNLLLLPDDSDFYYGTGSWAALHPSTTGYPNAHVLPQYVFMSPAPASMQTAPTNAGRGTMVVTTTKAQATTDLVITAGDGQNTERDIIPLYTAVPVEPKNTYGFSIQVKMANPSAVSLEILWFGEGGQPANYISTTAGTSSAPANSTAWFTYQVQGAAPAGAIYMVPAVRVINRIAGSDPNYSPPLYLAGAMAYLLALGGDVTVPPPDSYLTMGDPAEQLGAADTTGHPAFKPYILGSPNA
jgi:hypothetical protein